MKALVLVINLCAGSSTIEYASIIYVDGAFFVIGGYNKSKDIGRLDAITMIWSKAGELLVGRHGHNAIFDGSSVLVVGGSGSQKTEKCTISSNKMTCTENNPELNDYYRYPELFLVSKEFCKNFP